LLAAAFGPVFVAFATIAHAEPPPPGPPQPSVGEARAVVAAVPRADLAGTARRRPMHIEVQGHLATLSPDPEGVLTLDSGTPGQARWDALAHDEEIAGRVVLTWARACGEVTLSGTWWGSWQDEGPTAGTLASRANPAAPLNVTSSTGVGLRADASLWDASLGITRTMCPVPCLEVAWGGGVRYLHFGEEASFLFPTTVPPENAAVFTAELSSGLLAVEATARGTWRFAPRLALTVRGSAFAGWMRRSGRLATVNVNPPPALAGAHDDDLGWGAEAEVSLRWQVGSCWSVSAGVGALWVGPVARAFEAYDFSNVASSDLGPLFSDDTLFLQRVFVGLALDL
jgi:hypothetical protein